MAPVIVPGVHAYAEKSVRAGEIVHFRVSSDQRYRIGVYRLGLDPESTDGDEEVRAPTEHGSVVQPISPGSYVDVGEQLPPQATLGSLTLECWVRPRRVLGMWQGLLGQHTFPNACGVGIFISAAGAPAFYVGDGGAFNADGLIEGGQLLNDAWAHVVGTWDGTRMELWLNGRGVATKEFRGVVSPGPAPLRMAAYGAAGLTGQLLNGDLAMTVIYGRALTAEEIEARYQTRGLILSTPDDLLGCWPFDEEAGTTVRDVSHWARHGRIVNRATWMIGGPSFDPAGDPGPGYVPAEDPTRGHGLAFRDDDLYDCEWRTTHAFRILSQHGGNSTLRNVWGGVAGQPNAENERHRYRRRPERHLLVSIPFQQQRLLSDGGSQGGLLELLGWLLQSRPPPRQHNVDVHHAGFT